MRPHLSHQIDLNLMQESHNAEEKLNAGDDVRGASRDAFLVVVMDNQHRAPQVRPLYFLLPSGLADTQMRGASRDAFLVW